MSSHLNAIPIPSQDDLRYIHPEKQDFERVLQFQLEHFRLGEPISQSIGLTAEEGKHPAFIPYMVHKSLENPSSIMVLNDKDEIVAVNLTSIYEREKENVNNNTEEHAVELSGGAAKICKFLEHIESGYWDLVPKHCEKLAKLEIVAVRNDYTRKGIANKLIGVDYLENLKKLGCDGIVTVGTAFNSQNLFIKNGYEKLKEVKHEDWCDENGKRVFICADKTDRAILFFKKFD